jgi:hypothetical protein
VNAAEFQVTTAPSASIAPGGSTSFVVTFDPSAVGLRTAVVSFVNNDDAYADGLTETPFDFALQGTGVAPAMTNFPTSLSFSSVLGSTPASQVFSITNDGLGSMTWTLSTNVTWLSVSNVTGSAAAGAGQVHTAYVANVAGMAAGTSNATITLTSGEATNSPKTVTVSWTISAIPDPTAQTATASGAEHVALRWTKDASYNVMIVHRAGAASTAPSQGTAYSVGGSVGGGTVIYKGSGAYLDHVVAAGSTNNYAFYSYNGDYYSAGVTAAGTTTVYQVGEIVEPFAYTNGAGISGLNGGQGWTSTWTYVGGTLSVVTDSFTSISGYPSLAGNAITSASPEIYRGFAPVTAGKLYVAFMMRTDDGGNTKYNGLSFFDAAEEKFFGEGFSQINQLTVGSSAGRQLANNTDYTIIAMYDFDNDVAKALLYTNATESVPATEPVTWHVEEADATVGSISRIRLAGNTGARWDEIRVATSWEGLLQLPPTYIWDAGGGNSDRSWSNPTNWTANTEPVATSNAFIGSSFTGVVSQAGEVAADLFVGPGTTGTLLQTAGSLSVSNFVIGYSNNAVGVFEMSGGSLTVGVNMVVGSSGAGTAIVHGAGSKISVVGNIHVGMSNAVNRASFLHNAGTVTAANVYIGDLSATEGRYFMTNGVLTVGAAIYLAEGSINSTGRLAISGGQIDAPDIFVGRRGLGLMSVSGTATVNVNGALADIVIGDLANNNRTNRLTISGGRVNVGDNIELGDAAATYGSMYMSGGALTVTGQVFIGDVAGSTGEVTIAGGTADFIGTGGSGLIIGNAGLGRMFVHGGSVTVDDVEVGSVAGSQGFLTITNGAITSSVNWVVGNATGTGVLHIVGSSASITVGDGTTEDFTMQTAGAELRATFIGGAISPIRVQDDITVDGTLTISNDAPLADGVYVIATSLNSSVVSGTFTATNWLGGTTGTVVYTNRAIQIVIASPQEIAVLGTNSALISSGDLIPSTADGTDYGAVLMPGAVTLDRTFGITKSGRYDADHFRRDHQWYGRGGLQYSFVADRGGFAHGVEPGHSLQSVELRLDHRAGDHREQRFG